MTKLLQPLSLVALLAATATVSGCGGVRQAIGVEKVAPDEFKVVTQAPLTVPPDYQLRPPRPGDPRPQELRPDAAARAAVFGQDVGVGASPGEQNLIAQAGATAVDPSIRAQVDLEAGGVVRKSETMADQLAKAQQALPADATAEERRLAEEEAARRATGGAPVVIERRASTRTKLPGL
jgi:hypothetical protein